MSLKSEFESKYNIIDEKTPWNVSQSGHYKQSYAYYTLRSRLPIILTHIIDHMTKDKEELITQFGEKSREEIKMVIGLISRLKYELQTDKPFDRFKGQEPDGDQWNIFIAHLPEDKCGFFKGSLLHAEFYLYRKLYSFVENTYYLREFDYFSKIKKQTIKDCNSDIKDLTQYTRQTDRTLDMFQKLLKIDLWSNRNDLSKNFNVECLNNKQVLDDISGIDSFILVNNAVDIWNCLNNDLDINSTKLQQIDIICDNAGYELFADFILAEYMIEKRLATKVRFHVKAHPCFVADTTEVDFFGLLQYLCKDTDHNLSLIGKKFTQFLKEGIFELAPTSYFWTGPHAFFCMREMASKLYHSLSESKLIIFKGDVNYRKLLGDVRWDTTKELKSCVRDFIPTNFCTICTMKTEVICGLSEGVYNNLTSKDTHWMTCGNYGIIQFVDGSNEVSF